MLFYYDVFIFLVFQKGTRTPPTKFLFLDHGSSVPYRTCAEVCDRHP